jgi:hypothetical protein
MLSRWSGWWCCCCCREAEAARLKSQLAVSASEEAKEVEAQRAEVAEQERQQQQQKQVAEAAAGVIPDSTASAACFCCCRASTARAGGSWAVEEGTPPEAETAPITLVLPETTGSTFRLPAPSDTVGGVEAALAVLSGRPANEHCLLWQSKKLHDDGVTLVELGITTGEVELGLVPQDPAKGEQLRLEARLAALKASLDAHFAAVGAELQDLQLEGRLSSCCSIRRKGSRGARMMLCDSKSRVCCGCPLSPCKDLDPWGARDLGGMGREKHMRYFRFVVGDTVVMSWGKRADGSNQSAGALAWFGCGSAPPKRRTVEFAAARCLHCHGLVGEDHGYPISRRCNPESRRCNPEGQVSALSGYLTVWCTHGSQVIVKAAATEVVRWADALSAAVSAAQLRKMTDAQVEEFAKAGCRKPQHIPALRALRESLLWRDREIVELLGDGNVSTLAIRDGCTSLVEVLALDATRLAELGPGVAVALKTEQDTREEQERQRQRHYEWEAERNERRREAEQARETEVALWRGELRCWRCNMKLPVFGSRVCPDSAEDFTCET